MGTSLLAGDGQVPLATYTTSFFYYIPPCLPWNWERLDPWHLGKGFLHLAWVDCVQAPACHGVPGSPHELVLSCSPYPCWVCEGKMQSHDQKLGEK